MKRKLISWLLSLAMLLTMLPVTAWAEPVDGDSGAPAVEQPADPAPAETAAADPADTAEKDVADPADPAAPAVDPAADPADPAGQAAAPKDEAEAPAPSAGLDEPEEPGQTEPARRGDPSRAIVDSEYCGAPGNEENVMWVISDYTDAQSGEKALQLTIIGQGAMADYERLLDEDDLPYSTAPWDDYYDRIRRVVISDGVTNVGDYAFIDYDVLDTVMLGNTVQTIGEGAFEQNAALTTLRLGSGLKTIGQAAFYDCSALDDVEIPDSVTTVGKWAFFRCSGLKTLTVGAGVTDMGQYAFAETGVETLTLRDGMEAIGVEAFRACPALETVEIPDSVTTIGEWAFYECDALKTVTVGTGVTDMGKGAFYESGVETLTLRDGLQVIGERAFKNCAALETVEIPDSVKTIGAYAFDTCKGLKTVTIGTGVTEMGKYAFSECGIETLTLRDGLQMIGDDVFYGCPDLETLTVPGSVKTIGGGAFIRCTALKTVTLEAGVATVGEYAFCECSALEELTLNEGLETIDTDAFAYCSALETLALPSTVTTLGTGAFAYCDGLTSVTLNEGLETIGTGAFVGCESLTTLQIPASVTTIAVNGLAAIDNLTAFTVAQGSKSFQATDGVLFTADGATLVQYPCARAGDVYQVPDGVKTLGNGCFYDAQNVRQLVIPASVTGVEDYCFWGCDVEEILFLGDAPTFAKGAFDGCTVDAYYYSGNDGWTELADDDNVTWHAAGVTPPETAIVAFGTCGAAGHEGDVLWMMDENATLTITGVGDMEDYDAPSQTPWYQYRRTAKKIVVDEGVTYVGACAFMDMRGVTAAEVAGTVEEIGDMAFCDLLNMETLTLGEGVQSVGMMAFGGDEALTALTLPASLKLIGTGAFTDLAALESFTVAQGNTCYKDIDGVLFTADGEKLVQYPCGKKDEDYAIPAGTVAVAGTAFTGAMYIKRLSIPKSLTENEPLAFVGLRALESVTVAAGNPSLRSVDGVLIDAKTGALELYPCCRPGTSYTTPYGVTSVTLGAFLEAQNLKEVTFSSDITSLDARIFASCENLWRITFLGNAPEVNEAAFYDVTALVFYNPDKMGWDDVAGKDYGGKLIWRERGVLVDSGTCGTAGHEDDVIWTLDAKGTLIISGIGPMADYSSVTEDAYNDIISGDTPWNKYRDSVSRIVIEDGVTAIGRNAFPMFGSATELSIADSVKSIGGLAFCRCTALEKLDLPEGLVTIDAMAFYGCSAVESLTIPASVLDIQPAAFAMMDSLTEFTVAEGNTRYETSDGVLFTADGTTLVAYPGSANFWSYDVPDTVTEIGAMAFSGAQNLVFLNIGPNVTVTGYDAITACPSLQAITVAEDNSVLMDDDGVLFSKDGTVLVAYPAAREGYYYTIPDTVIVIGPCTFYGARYLREIVVGKNVTYLYDGVFEECSQLHSVTFLGAAPAFNSLAFQGFTGTVYYNGLTDGWDDVVDKDYAGHLLWQDITADPAGYCGAPGNEKNVRWTVEGTKLTISGTGDMAGYQLWDEGNGAYSTAPWYEYVETVTEIVIEDGVTSVGDNCFIYFYKVTDLSLPETLTAVGENSFFGLTGLKTLELPASLTYVAPYAFADLRSVTQLVIPANVEYIDWGAFAGMTSLTGYTVARKNPFFKAVNGVLMSSDGEELIAYPAGRTSAEYTVPDTVEDIWTSAFYNAGYLQHIIMPDSVEYVSSYAFNHSMNLRQIDFLGDAPYFSEWAFADCGPVSVYYNSEMDGWEDVVYNAIANDPYNYGGQVMWVDINGDPAGYCGSGYYAGNLTWRLEENTLYIDAVDPEQPAPMANYQWVTDADGGHSTAPWFKYRDSIDSVVIGKGVSTVGSEAFDGCDWIETVSLPEGLLSIGNYAFANCTDLWDIELPDSLLVIGVRAFYQASWLEDMHIGSNVYAIGEDAFGRMYSLEDITVSENNTHVKDVDGVLYSADGKYLLQYPTGREDEEYEIAEGTEMVVPYAFDGCGWLKAVHFPKSVTAIGDKIFDDCEDMCFLSFAGDCPDIASNAFYELNAYVRYPADNDTWTEEVMSKNYGAYYLEWYQEGAAIYSGFCGAPGSVESVTWAIDEDWVLTISGKGAMAGFDLVANETTAPWVSFRDRVQKIVVEEGVTYVGDFAFTWFYNVTDLELPESLQSVGECAFGEMTGLTELNLPDGLASVGPMAFCNCTAVEEFTIPASLTAIGVGAFGGMSGVKEFRVAEGNPRYMVSEHNFNSIVTRDGSTLVQYPAGRENPNCYMTNGITVVAENAFFGAKNVEVVSFSQNLTEVGPDAFYDCARLHLIYFTGDKAPVIGEGAFGGVNAVVHYGGSGWDNVANRDYGGTLSWVTGDEDPWGYCGAYGQEKDVIWRLSSENDKTLGRRVVTMTISGSGAMANYANINDRPYDLYLWNVDRVVVEGGVTYVGASAFEGAAHLTDAVVEEGVKELGNWVFFECYALRTVALPASLETVGLQPFAYCESLEAITVAQGSESFKIVGGALLSADGTKLYQYPAQYPGEHYDVPEGVTWIGASAFARSANLKSVSLPASVDDIRNYAFSRCPVLEAIDVAEDNENYKSVDGVLFTVRGTKLIQYPSGKPGTSYTVPDTVRELGDSAFRMAQNLEEITVNAGVRYVDANCFRECKALKHVIFTGKAPYLFSDNAFIDANVVVTYPAGDESWQEYVGLQLGGTVTWHASDEVMPARVLYSGNCGVKGSEAAVTWALDEAGVLTIAGAGAMADYDQGDPSPWTKYYEDVTAIVVKEGVTAIGEWAFQGARAETITLPASLETIGYCAFIGTQFNTGFTVAAGNASFRAVDGVLYDKDLTELVAYPLNKASTTYAVPEGVTAIDPFAIAWTMNLESITLPSTLDNLGIGLLAAGWELQNVYVAPGSTYLASVDGVLYSADLKIMRVYPAGREATSYTVLNGTEILAPYAFQGADKLTEIKLPDTLQSVYPMAFLDCKALTSLTLPVGVTSVQDGFVWGCDSLEQIFFLGDAPEFSEEAFSGYDGTVYYFADKNGWDKVAGDDYGGDLTWVAQRSGVLTGTGEATGVQDMQALYTYLSTGSIEPEAMQDNETLFRVVADYNGDKTVNILDYQAMYQAQLNPAS